ncbi:MAG: zinc ribbon domain-containing protein [Clostridia bacterium]|nr:zinc ribbon domain-containing protein [Clostridia bacterium]
MAEFNMDDMFDKIKTSAAKVSREAERLTKSAASKVESKTQEAKLKYAIRELEDKMRACYAAIGEAVYESFRNSEEPGDFSEMFGRLDALREEADEIKEQLAAVSGCVVCPECGAGVSAEDAFCSKCGANIKKDE